MFTIGPARFLERIRLLPERVQDEARHPFCVPALASLDLPFQSAATFLVGENGSGKSTLLAAIADLAGLPPTGGSRHEQGVATGPAALSGTLLAEACRPTWIRRPRDAFFFRAELAAHFAGVLDERAADPEFTRDPYALYGGRSLHTRSHGEAFIALIEGRMAGGLLLMDEPESALSPQRQLQLLVRLADLCKAGRTQLVIATHSPLLMTLPGAQLLSLDEGLVPVTLEETSHYQITRGLLECPERYWKHLVEP